MPNKPGISPIIIRQAQLADADQWSAMRCQLWPETKDQHRSDIADYFDGNAFDIEQVYLAEIEQKVIGFIELNIRNFAEGSRRPEVPYIEAWFIQPQYRQQGFGKALIEQAESWAKSLGYTELASDTELENQHSIQLHKQLGYKETMRIACFIKNL